MAPNDAHRYICVRPDEGLRHGQLTKLETQFLIVLRQIYDDRARTADVELDGTARVSIEDFKTRSEEHTSELQSLMRISYAVFCLKKKNKAHNATSHTHIPTHRHPPTQSPH